MPTRVGVGAGRAQLEAFTHNELRKIRQLWLKEHNNSAKGGYANMAPCRPEVVWCLGLKRRADLHEQDQTMSIAEKRRKACAAIIGGFLAAVIASPLDAAEARSGAEVRPGAGIDITISGFARFLAGYGDLQTRFGSGSSFGTKYSGFDFRNDTEVHIIAQGRHDRTGIEYGGTIEFEADTNRADNTDETWIFARGAFGELRFGDTDSAASTMRIGGYTVAVGTGGIDGTLVDLPAAVNVDFLFFEPSVVAAVGDLGGSSGSSQDISAIITQTSASEDTTKIVYFSPNFSGFQLGLSYAPDSATNGDALATIDDSVGVSGFFTPPAERYDDIITSGLSYTGSINNLNMTASVVGIIDPHDVKDRWGVYSGAAIYIGNFSFGAGYGVKNQQFDFQPFPDFFVSGQNKSDFFNLGAAYSQDNLSFSISYAYIDTDIVREATFSPNRQSTSQNVVFGVEYAFLPGLVLSSELGYFHFNSRADDDFDDQGLVGVTRLGLAF
jgi:outer membrane protein OmpU